MRGIPHADMPAEASQRGTPLIFVQWDGKITSPPLLLQ
jgi:hypothetical protein